MLSSNFNLEIWLAYLIKNFVGYHLGIMLNFLTCEAAAPVHKLEMPSH